MSGRSKERDTAKLTKPQRRVLRKLKRSGPYNAIELGCSVATLIALNRRGFIWVMGSFDSFAYPRKALAWIEEPGRAALAQS